MVARTGRLASALVLGLALSAAPSVARADATPEEKAAARQIFKDGKELEDKRQWKEALEKFTKVAKIIVTPGVRYHLGFCEENLGHLVAALNHYELATTEAKRVLADASSPDDIKRDAETALERAGKAGEALRERVPRVKLTTSGLLRVSRVLLDGSPIAAALVGTALPVDPGSHLFVVERKGKEIERKEITVAEGETKRLKLAVDDTGIPEDPPPEQKPETRSARAFELTSARIPSLALVVTGASALAATAIFWGLREDSILKLLQVCPSLENCPVEYQGTRNEGVLYTDLARGFLAAGGATFVVGTVLWFAVPGTVAVTPKKGTTTLVPLVAPGPGSVWMGVGGRF